MVDMLSSHSYWENMLCTFVFSRNVNLIIVYFQNLMALIHLLSLISFENVNSCLKRTVRRCSLPDESDYLSWMLLILDLARVSFEFLLQFSNILIPSFEFAAGNCKAFSIRADCCSVFPFLVLMFEDPLVHDIVRAVCIVFPVVSALNQLTIATNFYVSCEFQVYSVYNARNLMLKYWLIVIWRVTMITDPRIVFF